MLSEGYLWAGRPAEAAETASQVLTFARQCRHPGIESWMLRLLGEIAAQADPPQMEQAERYYRQSHILADELGMRPLVAHCHLGLGTLYQHLGRHDEAHTEVATAAEMYRAMEMTFWLEKATAALAQVAH